MTAVVDCQTDMNKDKRMIFVDSALSSGTVRSIITVSKDLEKYFRCFQFFSRYDEEVCASKGILNIPVLSIVLPLAWILGANVYVEELDGRFADSMNALQKEYQKIYPKAPFRTKLFVDELVENDSAQDGTALLFSGGVDSTYSLFSNRALNPRLIMIFGVPDIPISNTPFMEVVKTEYSRFAKREGLKINYIQTNALEILNKRRVDHLWWNFRGLNEGDFWNGIGFSLGQLGQVAPFSIGRFNRLVISAAIAHGIKEHNVASLPDTDEKISWASLHVEHVGCLHRYEKILRLKKLLDTKRIKFRVCWSDPEYLFKMGSMNCNKCEKCLRTIASLALAEINPNHCGFNVDDSTFDLMKILFEKKLLTQQHLRFWWNPLHKRIPDKIKADIFGSKQFFEWFKTLKLDSIAKPHKTVQSILYYTFPYSMYQLFSRIKISRILRRYLIDLVRKKYTITQPLELKREKSPLLTSSKQHTKI